MLLNEIAPVNTGGAFIIDVNENMSNCDRSLTVENQYLSGFPKQPPYTLTSKTFKSYFVFKNQIATLDHDPTSAEMQEIATKTINEFSNELYNVAKNQPVYLRFHIPPEVNTVSNVDLTALVPITFQKGAYLTGQTPTWRIMGHTTEISYRLKIDSCYAVAYVSKVHEVSTNKYKIFFGIQIQFTLIDKNA